MSKIALPGGKQRNLALLSLILILVLSACTANNPILIGSSVPAGQAVENDAVLRGNEIEIAGDVDGNVIAAGRNIAVDGRISGSLIAVGETITIDGQIDGAVYAAGVNLILGEGSSIGQNVYFGGVRLETAPGSVVGRDLYAISLAANLDGSVGRDFSATIGLLELINIVLQAVQGEGDIPNLFSSSSSVGIARTALISKSSLGFGSLGAIELSTPFAWDLVAPPPQTPQIDQEALRNLVFPRVQEFIALLILGALMVWLLPSYLLEWSGQAKKHPWQSTGYGFIAYVTSMVGGGLLAIILLAVGLAIGIISFWKQAFLFWLLGYSALGLAFGIFLLLMIYGSKIIVAYLAGQLILDRLSPDTARHKILALLLGLFLFELLRVLPYVGWIIGIFVTFMGLGAIWLAYRKKRLIGEMEELQAEQDEIAPEVKVEEEPPSASDKK